MSGALFAVGFAISVPLFVGLWMILLSTSVKRAIGRSGSVILVVLVPVGFFSVVLSFTAATARGTRAGARVQQLVILIAAPVLSAVSAVVFDKQCNQRGPLTCGTTMALFPSLAMISLLGATAFELLVLRRRGGSPAPFSALGRGLVREQVASFDAAHGRCSRRALMILLIGLVPDFWLAGVEGYYKFPIRKALSNLWFVIRCATVSMGIILAIATTLLFADGEASNDDALVDPVIFAAMGGSLLACALISSPANRRRVHAALGRLGTTAEEQRAAAVAALVGRVDLSDMNALTIDSFRVLSFDCLCETDFSSNSDSGLGGRSISVALGDCDAFLSHSWHDDAAQKWAALRSWADDFERATGRPPRVWLDKGCIDQQNIDASLAALPLYLAGCDRLVVVAGPTYASRLWCVIEIFTFLFMGGSRDRIDVLPIGDDTMEQVEQRLISFDAKFSSCFLEEDRERLLGIIEAGFGDYGAFNCLVRGALVERTRTSLTQRALERQRKAGGRKQTLGEAGHVCTHPHPSSECEASVDSPHADVGLVLSTPSDMAVEVAASAASDRPPAPSATPPGHVRV